MVSGLDLLGVEEKPKSGIELLGHEARSGIDLLKSSSLTTEMPTTDVPIDVSEGTYRSDIFPRASAIMSKAGFGPRPEGGWSEAGVPLDKEGKPIIDTERAGGIISETLKGLTTLATHPMETIRGGLDFALSIPGFLTGLIGASGKASKEFVDQIAIGNTLNLEEIYNAASEGMVEGMEFFQPAKELIVGKPTRESELATQVIMAPLGALSALGHEVAGWKGFNDYPNIRGASKFLGDISGFMAMGLLLHGGRRSEFAKDVEGIGVEARRIIEKEKATELVPDEIVKQAQKKVLEIEKQQLELKAKSAAEKLGGDVLIREELGRQAERVALEKTFPVEKTGLKKPTKKQIKQVVKDPIKSTEAELDIRYEGRQETIDGPSLYMWTDNKTKSTFATKEANVKNVETKLNEIRKPFEKPKEKIIEVDEQPGVEVPGLKGERSPFFQDKEVTETYKNLYSERPKAVESDPELMTQKLINDVNRWYHGDETIDIVTTREALSTLAARADELRQNYFITGIDHLKWKEVVQEGASWARGLDRQKISRSGDKFYSGIPVDEATKQLVKLYNKAKKAGEEARGMKALKPKVAAKMIKDELVLSFVDRSGNIRKELLDKLDKEGYEILQAMYLAKGSPSIAANLLKQMRKEVYGGLSRKEKKILNELIFHTRVLDIAKYKTEKQFKYLKEHPATESAAYITLFQPKESLSPKKAYELYHENPDGSIGGRVGSYFSWMKKPLQDMLEAELISQTEFDALVLHNYRRIKLVDIYDQRYKAKVGKKSRTVYDSGVESLAKGRDTDIFERSSDVMALEVFNRAYGRIMNNLANRELLELARKDKENPFVRVKDSPRDRIPTGWNRIFVHEGGKRKPLYISPEMSKEWITSNPETSYRYSQFLRYASGSPVLRTFATGINWGFALANLPRDIMHTWFTARAFENGKWKSVYSPTLPVFGLQMGRDLANVFSDAVLRKGRYEDYINEGGGMEFMVHQGRLFQRGRHLEGPIDKVYDFLGYFGETSEILTRLAIRERAMRQGKDAKEATFAARDYMDFGQGGGIAKALDNAMPYLNAAIQGTRGLLRTFKDNPAVSTYRLSQLAALTSGIYIAANKMYPKTMEAVKNDIDSQNNLIIPLGDEFGFEDSKGQMRYPYLKIPLDPGQKFFKKFFEASTDKWLGNEIDVDGTVESLKELSPVGVSSLPPTISGALGYVTNKDFWMNEDIWRRTDKPFGYPESKEEYIPGRTPEFYIDLGAKTGLSPERTKHVVEELTTNGTLWSYLLGQGYDAAFGDLPKDMREKHLAEVLHKIPVVRRFFGVTNPYTQYAGKIEEAEEKSDIDRWIQNRGLDMRVEGYLFQKNTTRKEVVDYIKSFKDKDIFDRLKDRFVFQERIKELPNRSFWLRLRGLSTEARAKVYVDRLNNSTPEERDQLRKEIATVIIAGGVVSKDFRREVAKLREKVD